MIIDIDDLIQIEKVDEVWMKIHASRSILSELSEYFTFTVPGAHYMYKYKMKLWDGKIRLLNRTNCTLYAGLVDYVKQFAAERNYNTEIDSKITSSKNNIDDYVDEFISSLKLPLSPRDYQLDAFKTGIENKRNTIVSVTGSGKSLIAYLIIRWFLEYNDKKVLLVVPTTSLCEQMYKEFENYSVNESKFSEDNVHIIYQGKDKNSDKKVFVSTWQSLYKQPKEYFEKFGCVIIDECHLASADSLKNILEKCSNTEYRYGMTGTLQETKSNQYVIQGLTGPKHQVTTTKTLMDNNTLASLKIKCLVLNYPEEDCKTAKKMAYPDEIEFLIANTPRNKFIRNLSASLKGNSLVMFKQIKQGKVLYEMIKEKVGDSRKVFYISGATETLEREQIREITETEENAILVSSMGVFSTGINIKNLEHIIFCSPTKSRIKTLQSIGRVLRVGRSDKATVWDICDDLHWKRHKNFCLKHFLERVRYYDEEKFEYTVHNVTLISSSPLTKELS